MKSVTGIIVHHEGKNHEYTTPEYPDPLIKNWGKKQGELLINAPDRVYETKDGNVIAMFNPNGDDVRDIHEEHEQIEIEDAEIVAVEVDDWGNPK